MAIILWSAKFTHLHWQKLAQTQTGKEEHNMQHPGHSFFVRLASPPSSASHFLFFFVPLCILLFSLTLSSHHHRRNSNYSPQLVVVLVNDWETLKEGIGGRSGQNNKDGAERKSSLSLRLRQWEPRTEERSLLPSSLTPLCVSSVFSILRSPTQPQAKEPNSIINS